MKLFRMRQILALASTFTLLLSSEAFSAPEEMDLCDYIVPVKRIENLTGMNFLVSLPEEERQALINSVGTFEGICPKPLPGI